MCKMGTTPSCVWSSPLRVNTRLFGRNPESSPIFLHIPDTRKVVYDCVHMFSGVVEGMGRGGGGGSSGRNGTA